MRNVLARLAVVLVYWVVIVDTFIGSLRGHWKWTLVVIVAFFIVEGVATLAMRFYMKDSNYGRRRDLSAMKK